MATAHKIKVLIQKDLSSYSEYALSSKIELFHFSHKYHIIQIGIILHTAYICERPAGQKC